jgi:hypothetical protein
MSTSCRRLVGKPALVKTKAARSPLCGTGGEALSRIRPAPAARAAHPQERQQSAQPKAGRGPQLSVSGARRRPASGSIHEWAEIVAVGSPPRRSWAWRSATEPVVLSACDTRLGTIETGEGVLGLRRAFLYAGASALLESLKEVPDEAVVPFMKVFYGALKSKQGKLNALHDAQLEAMSRAQMQWGAAHPFFWANFILVGDRTERHFDCGRTQDRLKQGARGRADLAIAPARHCAKRSIYCLLPRMDCPAASIRLSISAGAQPVKSATFFASRQNCVASEARYFSAASQLAFPRQGRL